MISIIVPSKRPEALKQCVKAVEENTKGFDYELLIDSETKGTYNAVRKMYAKAKGEWITHIPDDCLVQPLWMDRMMGRAQEVKDQVAVLGWKTYNEFEKHNPCSYWGKRFCAFIFIQKSICDKLGGLIIEPYQSFFGDPDLSMRVYDAGGQVIHLDTHDIYYYDKHDDLKKGNLSEFHDKDQAVFNAKWSKYAN